MALVTDMTQEVIPHDLVYLRYLIISPEVISQVYRIDLSPRSVFHTS